MSITLTPGIAVLVFGVLTLGGLTAGVNGFGFAVVGTALLAALVDPQAAVVLMILPMLAANVSLVRELDREGLQRCARRFWPFVAAAVGGTVVGMLFLSRVPRRPLALGLGLFVLLYVLLAQDRVAVPGADRLRGVCFRPTGVAKAGLGLVSGLVFGATNIGVQVIAYLESLDLDRSTFVGVVAMIFLGISVVRVGVAGALGLYGGSDLVVLSAVAVVPGLVGVAVGRRLRSRIPVSTQRFATFALLTVIGLRLTTKGLGIA